MLEGEANDYVGKGMSGGEIVIRPPQSASFRSDENVIVGNTVLYGATGGRAFIAGRAGERFAVRNSGAIAVVEGVGDHACEYMTRGCVVVLGPTGWNFGAGMSYGCAFVYDPEGRFPDRLNRDWVDVRPLQRPDETEVLYHLIAYHHAVTGSPRAAEIIAQWPGTSTAFWVVLPKALIDTRVPVTVPAFVRRPNGSDG